MIDLARFTQDIELREAIKQRLMDALAEQAVDLAFAGEETKQFKDCVIAIEKCFDLLEQEFIKEKGIETINQAR